MIQRIQTLLLVEVLFLSLSLLFIPAEVVIHNGSHTAIAFFPAQTELFQSTAGHYVAIALNLTCALVALITVFLFKKRELQVKLCYLLVILYVVLISMQAWCPFVDLNDEIAVKDSIFSYILLMVAALSSYVASRFVKKDIELLKSADRIR